MANLADRHIKEHAEIKNKPRSAKRACQLWDRCVLPKLGKRKVADIQRADVAQLITVEERKVVGLTKNLWTRKFCGFQRPPRAGNFNLRFSFTPGGAAPMNQALLPGEN